jgi:flagellar protein FlaE
MTINPRDYDLDELRKMAKQQRPGNGLGEEEELDPAELGMAMSESDGVPAGDSFRAGLYRELLPFLGSDTAEKPYLSTLPETYAAEFVVFEWLEFLLMHSGYHGVEEALDDDADIDWITEEVQSSLSDYLRGIDESGTNDGNSLDVDDHMLSLVYVAKLHSMD